MDWNLWSTDSWDIPWKWMKKERFFQCRFLFLINVFSDATTWDYSHVYKRFSLFTTNKTWFCQTIYNNDLKNVNKKAVRVWMLLKQRAQLHFRPLTCWSFSLLQEQPYAPTAARNILHQTLSAASVCHLSKRSSAYVPVCSLTVNILYNHIILGTGCFFFTKPIKSVGCMKYLSILFLFVIGEVCQNDQVFFDDHRPCFLFVSGIVTTLTFLIRGMQKCRTIMKASIMFCWWCIQWHWAFSQETLLQLYYLFWLVV